MSSKLTLKMYRTTSYVSVLKALIEEARKSDPEFSQLKLSESTGIQKTYLSKVLNETADLNSDQLYSVADFFDLTSEDTEYVLLLLEFGRCHHTKRKKELHEKIASIQSEHRNTKAVLKSPLIEIPVNQQYLDVYLDPWASVVHIFLTLSEYKQDYTKIQKDLDLNKEHFNRLIQSMVELKIIEIKSDKKVQVIKDHLQMPSDSPLIAYYQNLFRLTVAAHLTKLLPKSRFSYNITLSTDPKTKIYIHEAFLRFLQEIETKVRESNPEEVYQISFDLFPWKIS